MFRFVRFLLFFVGLSVTSLSQNPSNTGDKPDPIALLTEVKQKYSNIKTYRIEAILESGTAGEFSRNWNKSYLSAGVASGNRYRFEGRDQGGWMLKISDGKTEWMVDREANLYTQKPAPERGPTQIRIATMNVMGLASAQNLLKLLAGQPGRVLDPAYLPDETLTLNGQPVPCYVITGRRRNSGGARDASWQLTFWIEKERHVIRKVHGHGEGAMFTNAPYYRVVEDETTVYSVADLDPPSLPDGVFKFDPPAEAKLVDEFPDPMKTRGMDLLGKAAPDVKFHSAKGETVALASFRGRPILLDFWATWCAPCVASLPAMGKLYKETTEKGLVLLSVDEDEDAKTAADFLAQRAEPWRNFHDNDGDVQATFATGGVPELVLIDPSGKIVYVSFGFEEPALRTAVAKLGPEFASIAPTPKP